MFFILNAFLIYGRINYGTPLIGISFYDSLGTKLVEILREKFGIECSIMNNDYDYMRLNDLNMFVQFRGIFNWHYCHLFCGMCGAQTVSIESGYKRVCTNNKCLSQRKSVTTSWINYPRIDPVVLVLPITKINPITKLPACLLARKETFPPRMISCISGFIDPGESAETAAIRELKEEVKLDCKSLKYLSSCYWPVPSSLLISYEIEVPDLSNFELDEEELSFAGWFDVNEVKLLINTKHDKYTLPYNSIFYQLIKDWYDKTK